jgi:hypothetical protein
MNRFAKLIVLCAILLTAAQATSLPCLISTLNNYDAAGFSCSEGPLTFSNFTFSDTGSALPLLHDLDVHVAPQADGFDFQASFSAPSGTSLDVLIGYTVMVDPGFFLGDSLTMAGFAISGTGSIDIAESVCVGAAFIGAFCPGTLQTLHVFDGPGGFIATDSIALSGEPVILGIIKDLSVTGGTGLSAAQVSLVDNVTPFHVEPVPEVMTWLLSASGLVGIGISGRKFRT